MVSFFFVQLWKPICYYKDCSSFPCKNIKFKIPALSVISNLFTSSFTSTNNAFRCSSLAKFNILDYPRVFGL